MIPPVPFVVGETLQQATTDLHGRRLQRQPDVRRQQQAREHRRLSQNPPPGKSEQAGTYVKVDVSNGPPMRNVPNVVTETSGQAKHDLQAAGFQVLLQHVAVTDPGQDKATSSSRKIGRQLRRRQNTRR